MQAPKFLVGLTRANEACAPLELRVDHRRTWEAFYLMPDIELGMIRMQCSVLRCVELDLLWEKLS